MPRGARQRAAGDNGRSSKRLHSRVPKLDSQGTTALLEPMRHTGGRASITWGAQRGVGNGGRQGTLVGCKAPVSSRMPSSPQGCLSRSRWRANQEPVRPNGGHHGPWMAPSGMQHAKIWRAGNLRTAERPNGWRGCARQPSGPQGEHVGFLSSADPQIKNA